MYVLSNRNKVVSALSLFPEYLMIKFGGTKHIIHAQTNHRYNHRQRHVQPVAQQILFSGCHPQNIHTYIHTYHIFSLINELINFASLFLLTLLGTN
jgi:hypothetical protein